MINDLPVTESQKLRPVYERYLMRKHHMPLDPPTDEEKQDAIKVLDECHPAVWDIDELLLIEAELIFAEADGKLTTG